MKHSPSMLAVEVGSSRIKLGWFPSPGDCTSEKPATNLAIAPPLLPAPIEVVRIDHRGEERQWVAEVEASLTELALPPDAHCLVAAVRPAVADTLIERVLARQFWARIKRLERSDIAIETNVTEPARVGIDRLLNALAANRLRDPGRPAIVVDMGTAMTVNLITADGVFQGGAILAGPMTALAALHTATSSLPLLSHELLETPPHPVGKSTQDAMASGAYWGAIGAALQLVERMAATCAATPDVFLTGGAAAAVAEHMGESPYRLRYLPDLVLSGLYLAAAGMTWK